MRIVPDDVMVESTSYCRILPDGSEQDINYIVESDTIEITDEELNEIFKVYGYNSWKYEEGILKEPLKSGSQYLRELIELKRAVK